jgi:hypothetical protein
MTSILSSKSAANLVKHLGTVCVCLLVATAVLATAWSAAAAPPAAFINGDREVIYVDLDNPGEYEWRPERAAKPTVPSAISFSVIYDDTGTGKGFDDPTFGADAKAVVVDVLIYLDSVLNATGALDIQFNVSQLDGAGFLGSAGTFYPTGTSNFFNGAAFEHIVNGVDGPGTADISATIDFGHPWYFGSGTPPSGQWDFYSVILHEISHGLGFSSLANATGGSNIGSGVYSEFDDFLETGSPVRDLFFWNGATVIYQGNAT